MLDGARPRARQADDAYEAALDKAAHANLAADDDRRLVEHVDRVRATLGRCARGHPTPPGPHLPTDP